MDLAGGGNAELAEQARVRFHDREAQAPLSPGEPSSASATSSTHGAAPMPCSSLFVEGSSTAQLASSGPKIGGRADLVREHPGWGLGRGNHQTSARPSNSRRRRDVYWRDVFPGARSAACLEADPDVFFPETDEELVAALAICAACPVQEQCLE